jgi:hypothetical protein
MKRWIVDIEEDMQIIGIRRWRMRCKRNGRQSAGRLKPTVGCKVSKIRRSI